MAGGCSLPTALHAVERAEVMLGDTVLVLGSGPVGLSAIAFSTLRGARRVLCIGAPTARLDCAAAMGACETLDFTEYDEAARRDWVYSKTNGRGADVTIECTGAPQAVTQAMKFTRAVSTKIPALVAPPKHSVVYQYQDRLKPWWGYGPYPYYYYNPTRRYTK